jgi:hypothetical protein
MIRIIITLLVIIFFAGCGAGSTVKPQQQAEKNVRSLLSLDIGMTQDEVLIAMGKPKKKKTHLLGDRTIEAWFYLTEGLIINDTMMRESDYTPVVFEGRKLTGWGRNFYNRTLQYKHETE